MKSISVYGERGGGGRKGERERVWENKKIISSKI